MRTVKPWRNPLERFNLDTPPCLIARTAANIVRECRKRQLPINHGHERRSQVLAQRYLWPDDAIAAFESYIALMSSAEIKRAVIFGDAHFHADYENVNRYQQLTAQRYFEQKDMS